ncbi:MAG: hypothetical protein GX774_11950 [Armatimonadetes bacterium]|jgi:hypothetical protein|nr:hypothetical protein [Armatimonadota bacterium]
MSYCIRVLAPVEEVPTAAAVTQALHDEGFAATVSATPAAENWERLVVELPDQPPVTVRRSLRQGEENPVEVEVDAFLDELLELEETPGVRQVEEALRRARQLIMLEVPDTYAWGQERTVVDALVELFTEPEGSLIQADGEGFYDRKGDLLVPLE